MCGVVHGFKYAEHRAIGGRVALGTDYPTNPTVGMPLNEILMFASAGMPNRDIVTASTYNSALACGIQNESGSLEAGKIADIIIVNVDVLDNILALGSIDSVILGGEIIVP
ncbi:MAG: amidohydrolase family protein [Chloroflexi bacterium]|nr:amidohydrolase family protein [Chloroflexota bacterium]